MSNIEHEMCYLIVPVTYNPDKIIIKTSLIKNIAIKTKTVNQKVDLPNCPFSYLYIEFSVSPASR